MYSAVQHNGEELFCVLPNQKPHCEKKRINTRHYSPQTLSNCIFVSLKCIPHGFLLMNSTKRAFICPIISLCFKRQTLKRQTIFFTLCYFFLHILHNARFVSFFERNTLGRLSLLLCILLVNASHNCIHDEIIQHVNAHS